MGMRDRLRQLSLNTATTCHQWPLARLAQACAHVGLGGIAPWRRDLAGLPPATARRAIAEAGLACTSLCRGSFLTHAGREQRQAVLDDNRRAIDEAHELGAPSLCMVVGGLSPGSKSLAYARAQVQEMLGLLLEHARPAGVRLAIDPCTRWPPPTAPASARWPRPSTSPTPSAARSASRSTPTTSGGTPT